MHIILFLKIPLFNWIIQKLIIEPRIIKSLIKRIIQIDNDNELYSQYLEEPWYPNNKLTKYVDDKLINKRIREIFSR